MYFLNNLFLILLLFAPYIQQGQGAPSQELASKENEEIEEQTVGETEGVSANTNPSSPLINLDQSSGEETGIPRTTLVGEDVSTENVDHEKSGAKSSSTSLPNEDTSQESDKVQGGTTGLVTTSSETGLPEKETTLNGATVKSEENEPEGSKAPESDASEPSGATEPSENESSTKTGTTVSITSSLDGKLEAGTSGNDAQSNEDNPDSNDSEHSNDVSQHNDDDSKHSDDDSEPSADDSEPSKDDSKQVINQFQNQDFSKGTTVPKEESATSESMTSAEEGQGSLYLGSSSDESSGVDFGLQVEDQEQQQEEQEEGGEEIEESRSLLSRWWLWLLMLCLGLGLGLLCKARINAKQGEAEYLRMGERHQGSTITIPR